MDCRWSVPAVAPPGGRRQKQRGNSNVVDTGDRGRMGEIYIQTLGIYDYESELKSKLEAYSYSHIRSGQRKPLRC